MFYELFYEVNIPAKSFVKIEYGLSIQYMHPGHKKMSTSVHFLARKFLRILLHISPQFQREMSTKWR